jgi:hypothetical protein
VNHISARRALAPTRIVDRRPVDPPPVVEVQSLDHGIQ